MPTFAWRPDTCPRCRGGDVRASRRPRGLLARVLGLWRHRCMSCMAVVWTLSRERGEGEP